MAGSKSKKTALKKPDAPRSITGPKRENTTEFTVSWKTASTYSSQEKKWGSVKAYVYVNGNEHPEKSKVKGKEKPKKLNPSTTEYTYKLTRSKWYPLKPEKLNKIAFKVKAINKKGSAWSSAATITFKKPKKPSCEFDYDDTTGLLTITCKAPVDDVADKYDCHYEVYRKDTKTNSSRYGKRERLAFNTDGKALKGESTKTEFTLVTNIEQVALVSGASIDFTVKLNSRGFVGDTAAKETFTIKPPEPVAIKSIDISNKDFVSLSKNVLSYGHATGMVRVFYYTKTRASVDYDEKGVTDYSLQRLVVPYDVNRQVEAAVSDGWEEVDTNLGSTSDMKKATKIADGIMGEPLMDVLTAMGFNNNARAYDVRVWYRVKSVRQGQVVYSKPRQCKDLAIPKPTAQKDYSGFMALKNSTLEPGTAVDGVVGWDNANLDGNKEGVNNPQWADATWTTVVEYSTHKNAIKSNSKPDSLTIDWVNKKSTHKKLLANYTTRVNGGEFGKASDFRPWQKSAGFSIYGLSPGVKYYFWTRRHMVLGEYDEYGPRTKAPDGYFPFTPIDNPTEVQVYTEDNYIYGSDMTVSWSHNAVSDQKAWSIYAIKYSNSYKEGITRMSKIPKKLIACGTGKINTYKVHAGNLNAIQPKCAYGNGKYFTIDRKIGIAVGVSTGGKEVLSCADEKGYFIGANYLDIGHVPSGNLGYISPKPEQVENYSIQCSGGYPGTVVVLDFQVKMKSDNAIVVTLSKVHCAEMRKKISLLYTYEIHDSSDKKKPKLSGSGVLESPTKSNSNKKTRTVKINRTFSSYNSNVKVLIKVTGGMYLDDNNVVKRDIPKSSANAVGMKTLNWFNNHRMGSRDHYAYLFSRTMNVTGSLSVFSVYDTSYCLPDGDHVQPSGECVFTREVRSNEFGNVNDILSEGEKTTFSKILTGKKGYPYVAKVNVYSYRNMLEGSTYIIQGYLRDTYDETLVSESLTCTFKYEVSHQAKPCGKASRIESTVKKLKNSLHDAAASTGSGYADNNMPPSPSVEIYVDRPDNYLESDRYDIYRMTADGGVRIAANQKFDYKVFVDRYAPFSKDDILRYAIVTVTAEGDMAWKELRYSMRNVSGMRFDWGSLDNQRALELPFDVELSDGYAKDYRIDTYLDGSVAAVFNKAVTRTASNKAKLVNVDFSGLHKDPYKQVLLRELARYSGPVFFRADNGTAYECVVDVDGVDESYDSLVTKASFKITEINPPSERFSNSNSGKDSSAFTPPSVGQVPKTTSSKKETLVNTKSSTSSTSFQDNLMYESKAFSKVSKKVYKDLKVFRYTTVTSSSYIFGFSGIELNLKKALNPKLSKNSYVQLGVEIKEGNRVIGEGYWNYGYTGSKQYMFLVPKKKCTIEVKRKKTDRNVQIRTYVYLLGKRNKENSTHVVKTGINGKNYMSLSLKRKGNPDGSNPDTVRISFDKLTLALKSSTNVSGKYRITVSSKSCNSSGYEACTKYYDSGAKNFSHVSRAKKPKTFNIGKHVDLLRKSTRARNVYVNLIVTNASGTTEYKASKKLKILSSDALSDISTNTVNPKTINVKVKKK